MSLLTDDILDVLATVIDPELGMNVVDLGLVYDVDVQDNNVSISMTMTTSFQPTWSGTPLSWAHLSAKLSNNSIPVAPGSASAKTFVTTHGSAPRVLMMKTVPACKRCAQSSCARWPDRTR